MIDLAIRSATAGDAGRIAAIYAPHVRDGHASFEETPPTAEEMARRVAATQAAYPWIVATDDAAGDVLGYAYASRFRERAAYRHTVETTVYVSATAQRSGVGRALYSTLIERLVAAGFIQAIGGIALPNAASVALHEAMGFRQVALLHAVGLKHGRWVDVGYWQRALAQPDEP